ncbi:MAG: cytochrome-c peroxidase [Bacteroidia bacterium]|nr:cytochrome-c peroxidase [Bacteroidia bacterium]
MPAAPFIRQAMLALGISLILSSCRQDDLLRMPMYEPYPLELPPGFPDMPVPDDNPLTTRRVALGKKLFYDPLLSIDSTVSCATCHLQNLGFTDGNRVSEGVHGGLGFRNAPALVNLAWNEDYMRDGGVPTLELQVLAPVAAEVEMGINFKELVDRLNLDPTYPQLFREAFDRDEVDAFGITRALAAFERILVSGNNPYDQYRFQGKTEALNASEQRGMLLFESNELGCTHCHGGFDLRKNGFENNGLYAQYVDSGRTRVTLNPDERGKFKVPSLRNVAVTAPYMHDGSLTDLWQVIDHYASGGKGHPNQSEFITGFTLTTTERTDLYNFLHALTDQDFLQNPAFSEE